jgi:RecQ family ATP-dependent DNA helicase
MARGIISPHKLEEVLTGRFGFTAFRKHQEEVCQAVAGGADALLVMPTGSGKSLCYQVPGIVREGTTLVVSPLIALIEDQVLKLQEMGFRAERIHSGRERDQSRRVCREYLAGTLDFLFIAPERLSVPGFPELLARRPPKLVTVDEAHCISHWGHDFRPDYRLLGERLPLFRPAPILALTATATVRVQKDIVKRLDMSRPKLFIRGFWRDNLAVEARDCPRKERPALVRDLLSASDAQPAIVYVPTRKEAEALATDLTDLGARPYHAGLEAEVRSGNQAAFMADKASIIVATVAFGMGVDKPNIRTVIHTSLTGSIESYYQEIGRAGRDGKPARVVLLYSWSDRKLLEFLHSCSYPPPEFLRRVLRHVPDQAPAPREEVLPEDLVESDQTEAALRQLYNHGALIWTPDDRLQRIAGRRWTNDYVSQREHRLHQIEDMVGFAQSGGCRMHGLVNYFSPDELRGSSCGVCDHCAPQDTRARTFRAPNDRELRDMGQVLAALGGGRAMTPKQLHEKVFPGGRVDRDQVEVYLNCLSRADLIRSEIDSFEKDGRVITFQRISATSLGRQVGDLSEIEIWIDAPVLPVVRASSLVGRPKRVRKARPAVVDAEIGAGAKERYEALKAWRVTTAKTRRCPPFRIASNATLRAISKAAPDSHSALQKVKGMGPAKVQEFGDDILRIVRESIPE